MRFHEAGVYLKKDCLVTWIDRNGIQRTKALWLRDIQSDPLFGPYFVAESDAISLERIVSIEIVS